MIKSLIVPLLFATLVVSIAGHGDDIRRVGRLAFRPILYFEVATTLALMAAQPLDCLLQALHHPTHRRRLTRLPNAAIPVRYHPNTTSLSNCKPAYR